MRAIDLNYTGYTNISTQLDMTDDGSLEIRDAEDAKRQRNLYDFEWTEVLGEVRLLLMCSRVRSPWSSA